jgi:hypothetical protein
MQYWVRAGARVAVVFEGRRRVWQGRIDPSDCGVPQPPAAESRRCRSPPARADRVVPGVISHLLPPARCAVRQLVQSGQRDGDGLCTRRSTPASSARPDLRACS